MRNELSMNGAEDWDYLYGILSVFYRRASPQWSNRGPESTSFLGNHGDIRSLSRLCNAVTLGALVLLMWLILANGDRGILLGNPMPTAILGSASTGFGLVVFWGLFQLVFCFLSKKTIRVEDADESIPLGDNLQRPGDNVPYWRKILIFVRSSWKSIIFSFIAMTLRLHAFVFVTTFSQCAYPGIEAIVPLVVVLWRRGRNEIRLGNTEQRTQTVNGIMRFVSRLDSHFVQDLVVAVCLTLSNSIASYLVSWPWSTYVCDTYMGSKTLAVQVLSLVLDVFLLKSLPIVLQHLKDTGSRSLSTAPLFFGILLLIESPVLLGSGFLVRTLTSIHAIQRLDAHYYQILISAVLLAVLLVLFLLRLVKLFFVMTLVFISLDLTQSWQNRIRTSYLRILLSVIAPALLFIAVILHSGLPSHYLKGWIKGPRRWLAFIFYTFFFAVICLALLERYPNLSGTGVFYGHPIDNLMLTAQLSHGRWLSEASRSKTLADAARNYRLRYDRSPPPGFDMWYKFATQGNSVIIDDFDSINQDLAPFWALSPEELRILTKEAVQDQWTEVVEIQIRSGEAKVSDKVWESHRWMLDGVVEMMGPFIQYLPDMDLAFNINDEARVVVPFEEMKSYLDILEQDTKEAKTSTWSPNRAASFDIAADQTGPIPFENWSQKQNFLKYSSIACPPNSPARQTRSWDWSRLCVSCYKPHSEGQFLKDWIISSSPCHQPDLADLDGFYRSASAFKTARQLLPVFSQSKPGGYADILYPTAWNFKEKTVYAPSAEHGDPAFSQKKNSLFWRGSTTEGYSLFGIWRGMTRQRLTFLNTNSTQSLPVYLPLSPGSDRYTYHYQTRSQLLQHPSLFPPPALSASNPLTLDTRPTAFKRGWDDDKATQAWQFGGEAPGVDFQDHWKHRYLMDMDGAAFSGRFLPFLRSRSLPFKTALFREWYDTRITAWLHFVPIDLRLHGLWSTLAYFAGGFGAGQVFNGLPRDEWIAEQGRQWAGQVLRKEDMEIYLFRLLLEWGRLTDDRREELGFVI